jgi:hypothetical protein
MADPNRLLEKLVDAGFSAEFVRATLPAWWTPQEANSSSAQTLVALLLARRLSLDPETLLDDNVPVGFLHTGPIKFNHLRLRTGQRRDALTAFGQGVARIVFSEHADDDKPGLRVPSAAELRDLVFQSGADHVGFGDVLSLCWSLQVPVLHLRLFPARTKGITAMTVRIGERYAILVARESGVPAQYMFHVAHELGHIALGHLVDSAAIVDADPTDPENAEDLIKGDDEEEAADQFAQELLTGDRRFQVTRASLESDAGITGTPRELAQRALQAGQALRIDPGHIVMCYGESTGEWALAQSAAKLIPSQQEKPGTLVNTVFWEQVGAALDPQSSIFLRAVAPL